MPHIPVQLHGSNGTTTVDLSNSQPTRIPVPESTHREAVFAALRELRPRFKAEGLTTAHYWQLVRSELGIESRTEMSDAMWARLSATLNCCCREKEMFVRLVKQIKGCLQQQQTLLTDATPVLFADPEDTISTCFVLKTDASGKETLVYIGEFSEDVWERCQNYADKMQCLVNLFHNGMPPEPFHPRSVEMQLAQIDAEIIRNKFGLTHWTSTGEEYYRIKAVPTSAFWAAWERDSNYVKTRQLVVQHDENKNWTVYCFDEEVSNILIGRTNQELRRFPKK